MKLGCKQFENLISFYINDELTVRMKKSMNQHMEECPHCKEKYQVILSIINDIRTVYSNLIERNSDINEITKLYDYEEGTLSDDNCNGFELSAYIDNELSEERSIKIRQSIGSKPKIRKKIEKLYNLRKILQDSYHYQKGNLKQDYSKYVARNANIVKMNERKDEIQCISFITFVLCSVFFSVWLVLHLI